MHLKFSLNFLSIRMFYGSDQYLAYRSMTMLNLFPACMIAFSA